MIVTCINCGKTFEVNDNMQMYTCNNCGCQMSMQPVMNRRQKSVWGIRFAFILAEAVSLIIALFLCEGIAAVLDTAMFKENNWLIFAVWLFVAYEIYKFFRYRGLR